MADQKLEGLVLVDEDAISEENIKKLEKLGFVVIKQKPMRKVEFIFSPKTVEPTNAADPPGSCFFG